MADSKLELVVTVDADKANASIKSVNAGLSLMEQTAVRAARGASQGIDGLTASMTKAVVAGQAIYDAVVRAARGLAGFTPGAFQAADELGKTAQKVGVGVEQLAALKHAAELSDVAMETLSWPSGFEPCPTAPSRRRAPWNCSAAAGVR